MQNKPINVEAYPVNPSSPPLPELLPNIVNTKEYLNAKRWPQGVTNFFLNNVKSISHRFIICDDSGSMATNDGKRIDPKTNKVVSCTRWTEMVESLRFHSALAKAVDLPCEFRMLNSSVPTLIGGPEATPGSFDTFQQLLSGSPGMTIYFFICMFANKNNFG